MSIDNFGGDDWLMNHGYLEYEATSVPIGPEREPIVDSHNFT